MDRWRAPVGGLPRRAPAGSGPQIWKMACARSYRWGTTPVPVAESGRFPDQVAKISGKARKTSGEVGMRQIIGGLTWCEPTGATREGPDRKAGKDAPASIRVEREGRFLIAEQRCYGTRRRRPTPGGGSGPVLTGRREANAAAMRLEIPDLPETVPWKRGT